MLSAKKQRPNQDADDTSSTDESERFPDDYPSTDEDEECVSKYGYSKPPLEKLKDIDYSFKQEMTETCAKFNMYAEFLGNEAKSSRPWTRGSRVLKARQELQETLDQLKKKVAVLKSEVEDFAVGTAEYADAQWYRHVDDLTVFKEEDLSRALHREDDWTGPEPMEVECKEDFLAYLKENLVRWSELPRPETEECWDFGEKLKSFHFKLMEDGDWDLAMHLSVFIKCRLVRRDPGDRRKRYIDIFQDHRDFCFKIHEAVDLGDMTGNIPYWDFATAWREMWANWQILEIDEKYLDRGQDIGSLLRLFHERSYKEIRERTQLALTGPQPDLPPELAELVFECAMDAEGVPLRMPHLPELRD